MKKSVTPPDPDVQRHETRIEHVLGAVYRDGRWDGVEHATPLSDLLATERADGIQTEEEKIRDEAFARLVDFLFADGPHPGCVVRRIFALAKAIRPQVLCTMSLEEIHLMLGETRAAGSWRIKKIFSGYLAAAGGRAVKARFQKLDTARAAMSRAQRGNHNRADGARRKKAAGAKINGHAPGNGCAHIPPVAA